MRVILAQGPYLARSAALSLRNAPSAHDCCCIARSAALAHALHSCLHGLEKVYPILLPVAMH